MKKISTIQQIALCFEIKARF
ncbi:hypothetical protein BVI1335_2340019 [Burkholderia vietnamiensis]|nr:hypothetical protein BVI1335_2340019 [Burkholderia vietnamiensis]